MELGFVRDAARRRRGSFGGASPVKPTEVPAFAPTGAETKPRRTVGNSCGDGRFHWATPQRTARVSGANPTIPLGAKNLSAG